MAVLAILWCAGSARSQSDPSAEFFPRNGDAARHQYARDLTGTYNVLCLALQPGYEDLATLAYFRLAKGARVMTAYISNGEAGESDVRADHPLALAALRREEAWRAMAALDGEAYFFNLPDIAAARDSAAVRSLWPADSLSQRLRAVITDFQPDLILIARDFGFSGSTIRSAIIAADARGAVRQAREDGLWNVARIAQEVSLGRGASVRTGEVHPFVKLSYHAIAETAAAYYSSLFKQRAGWRKGMPKYRMIYASSAAGAALDAGLPAPPPARFRSIAAGLKKISGEAARLQSINAVRLLVTASAYMDSIDYTLMRVHPLTPVERRLFLRWKAALDGIRNNLLGVRVEYTVSDSILTNRQLTYLTITNVVGIHDSGITELYVPAIDGGWILNEDLNRRVPLEIDKDYRLISPERLDYDHPHAEHGIFASSFRKPMYFFVIHRAGERSKSFVYRGSLSFSFAPKFTVEVLTPIVRAMPGETVIVRLTNHSRDGVRDSVYIGDSLAIAPGRIFRLNEKGGVHVDTLHVQWSDRLSEGSHLVDVLIAGLPQARFVARKFDVLCDTSRRVAVVPGVDGSPTLPAVRRIGLHPRTFKVRDLTPTSLQTVDVLILDRRAAALHPNIAASGATLREFVEQGGHLIVLSQEHGDIAKIPLLAGITVSPTFRFDERTPVALDRAHAFLSSPNSLTEDDFAGWVFERAHNAVGLKAKERLEVPLRAERGSEPLLVSRKIGMGRVTYTDLALAPQWMNVHAGALRLLANMISAHERRQ